MNEFIESGEKMKEEKFASLEELYKRLKPALSTKMREMHREKMISVTERDIWQYLCSHLWRGKYTLTLGEMVNDILNTDSFTIYRGIRED